MIGVVPSAFALDLGLDSKAVAAIADQSHSAQVTFERIGGKATLSAQAASQELNGFLKSSGKVTPQTLPARATENARITQAIAAKTKLADVPKTERKDLRSAIYLVSSSLAKLKKSHAIASADDAKSLSTYKTSLDKATNFIPLWVKVAVAFALGLGTMIGWKRIVVTVGEPIGKTHLTYGQGASAEIVAYGTIQAADIFGLPVSTTHILSSGVAGTNDGEPLRTPDGHAAQYRLGLGTDIARNGISRLVTVRVGLADRLHVRVPLGFAFLSCCC